MDPRTQVSFQGQPQVQQSRRVFFSSQNESMLYGMLSNNFQQKLGSQLNEKQSSRLERALEHYMSEVFQANTSLPVQTLNKEVLTVTASDFTDYLQRQQAVAQAPANTFMETSQRYDQIQADRQRAMEAPRPAIPDYVQPMLIKEDESVSALSLFEEAKKRRNMETSAQAEEQIAKRSAAAQQPLYLENMPERPDPRAMFDKPLDMVLAGSPLQRELPGRGDGNPTIARPDSIIAKRNILPQDILIKQEDIQSYKETEYNLSIYSADRNWELSMNTNENRFNFTANLNSNNSPTGVNMQPKAANRFRNIVRIEFVKAVVPIEAIDVMVRKLGSTQAPDLQQAIANAQAIAITSVNAGTSSSPYPTANLATTNLKALKDLNTLLNAGTVNYDTTYLKNIYSFPFITLNISELDTNTYGTSSSMDSAFGILQYDSNWTDNTDSLGFTSLIPKHMKCQRIYAPTPLATLNKLSIRLQQPNGNLVNTDTDTLDISGFFMSNYTSIRTYFTSNRMDLSGVVYTDADTVGQAGYTGSFGEYIWIETEKWFSKFQVAVGDRIQLKNLSSSNPTAAVTDVINFLQDTNGLLVVGVAWDRKITTAEDAADTNSSLYMLTTGVPGQKAVSVLIDGSNNAGYSRYIIVRGKFADPRTGSTSVSPYGGAADNLAVSTAVFTGTTKIIGKTIPDKNGNNIERIPPRLINLSRQTQFIFRVITREYDSTSLVRPDNL